MFVLVGALFPLVETLAEVRRRSNNLRKIYLAVNFAAQWRDSHETLALLDPVLIDCSRSSLQTVWLHSRNAPS